MYLIISSIEIDQINLFTVGTNWTVDPKIEAHISEPLCVPLRCL
jgi:hypothetical protein